MENVRTHIYIKLVTANRKGNYLVSEPSYHTAKRFSKDLIAAETKK